MSTKRVLLSQPVHAPYGECRGVITGIFDEGYLVDVCRAAVLFSDDGKLTLSRDNNSGAWSLVFVVSDEEKRATFLQQASLCGTFS